MARWHDRSWHDEVMAGRTDQASRVVQAAPSRIFAALIDRDSLERWLPPSGMSARFESFDARPGGSYRLVLSYDGKDHQLGKTSSTSDVTEVHFVELRANELVIQTVEFVSDDPSFDGTMTMTWLLRATGNATEVTIRAENVPVGISPEDHAVGMRSTLENLARFVEGLGE